MFVIWLNRRPKFFYFFFSTLLAFLKRRFSVAVQWTCSIVLEAYKRSLKELILIYIVTVIIFFFSVIMIAKQNAAFTSSCKATATSSSAKTEGRRCLADWVKHNWYISQLGSTLHMWTHCLIRTFSLDAFATSSGMNLETDKHQSQNQRNDHFHMDRTKTVGTMQYFTLKYKGKMRPHIGWSKC